MSVLSSILGKIFHGNRPAPSPAAPEANPAVTTANATPGTPTPAPSAPTGTAVLSAPAASPAGAQVDVEAVLTELARKNPEKLDWRTSIVDLMKLLGLDSSLAARKELAKELHYDGDTGDTARMNVWLHEQVMRKLAEHGGKVPAELQHH
jgi:hypothetical protein